MKVCLLVLLAVLAVAVAAEEYKPSENLRVRLMKRVLGVQRFFKEDPLGKKIVEQLEDLLSIMGLARQRLRHRLANYLKNLEE
ncbi:hypothetical protein SprV_0702292000 [Sparganum proliferum]